MKKLILLLVITVNTVPVALARSSGAEIYSRACIIDGKVWTDNPIQCPLYSNMSNQKEREKYKKYLEDKKKKEDGNQ